MEDLSKWTLGDLKETVNDVNKDIIEKEKFLGELNKYFIMDGEICAIYNLKITKVKDLKNRKTGKPLYNEKQLRIISGRLNDLSKLKYSRNELSLAITRKKYGEKYYAPDEKLDKKDREKSMNGNRENANIEPEKRISEETIRKIIGMTGEKEGTNKTTKKEKKTSSKKKWNGSKSDFARFVREEYTKNGDSYSSRSAAVRKLYGKYKFDFKWSVRRCEDLVKKV